MKTKVWMGIAVAGMMLVAGGVMSGSHSVAKVADVDPIPPMSVQPAGEADPIPPMSAQPTEADPIPPMFA